MNKQISALFFITMLSAPIMDVVAIQNFEMSTNIHNAKRLTQEQKDELNKTNLMVLTSLQKAKEHAQSEQGFCNRTNFGITLAIVGVLLGGLGQGQLTGIGVGLFIVGGMVALENSFTREVTKIITSSDFIVGQKEYNTTMSNIEIINPK